MMTSTVFEMSPLAHVVDLADDVESRGVGMFTFQAAIREEAEMLMKGVHWGSSRWDGDVTERDSELDVSLGQHCDG